MCGIAGFISKDDKKNKKVVIKKMTDKIQHRGPDGDGFYVDSDAAIGHRRLAIIDIKGGIQPMIDGDFVLTYNGEIYNYKELKSELEKEECTFKTSSDTEVILVGYQKWGGDALVKKLRGMFAFAIWDKKSKTLFCARDPFGMKPFYYYQNAECFMFASEIKAFLENPHFHKELDQDILGLYLAFSFNPSNKTFFKDVYSLNPGCYLTFKDNKINIQRYYKIEFNDKYTSLEEASKDVEEVMQDSISHHLLSDVPVGAFLSSGIDSSLVVSIAKTKNTYTIGYNQEKYNEVGYAKDLTKRLKLDNYNKFINKEEYMKMFPTVLYHMDEPLADPSIVSLYYLCNLASKDVKVALGGEGADEFFAGYNTYNVLEKYQNYNRIPYFIRHILANIFKCLPNFKGRNFVIRSGSSIEEDYLGVSRLFTSREIKKMVSCNTNSNTRPLIKEICSKYKDKSDLVKMQAVDINCWLVKDILLKSDKMAMANSLEVRCPFVDKEVFKVASQIPKQFKVSQTETKIALRRAAQKFIPNESYKKKKLGFPVPLREWVREDDVYEEILKTFNASYTKEFFNQKYIIKLLEDHKNHKKDNYKKVWSIFSFLKWYEIYFLNN